MICPIMSAPLAGVKDNAKTVPCLSTSCALWSGTQNDGTCSLKLVPLLLNVLVSLKEKEAERRGSK